MSARVIAVDQYGRTILLPGVHPRAELLAALGYRKADRMYVDRAGTTLHIGYIVGGRWFSLFRAEPIEKPA